jgi:6-phosphogluconate dehydrogenase
LISGKELTKLIRYFVSEVLFVKLGIIGLGKMGGNIALQAVERGITTVGKSRGPKPELAKNGVIVVEKYNQFVNLLDSPRVIFLSLPAGPVIDSVINDIVTFLNKGDVILDGGNSYYKDSIVRAHNLSERGIYFLDCGTSGGVYGARHRACFMVGGKLEAVKICEPILKLLSVPGGYLYCGDSGSGHFVKLVHNGIEFGMLQAIGEGFELLQNGSFTLNLEDVFRVWSHGSVIRSWLIELMEKGLRENLDFKKVPDYVEDTGEVNWLVEEAIQKEIPIPVITQAVIELFRSRRKESESARAIAIMRHGFGGHPFGKDDYIAKERKISRIHSVDS